MNTVISKDGTKIAYDKQGSGPTVILIAGALCSRLFWSGPELATRLASHFIRPRRKTPAFTHGDRRRGPFWGWGGRGSPTSPT